MEFVLPVVRDRIAVGESVDIAASWAVFARGVDGDGEAILKIDRQLDAVRRIAAEANDEPSSF